MKLGAGEDLYALFAGILTMRPWNRVINPAVDHLVIQGSESDHSELQVISFPFATVPYSVHIFMKTFKAIVHLRISFRSSF